LAIHEYNEGGFFIYKSGVNGHYLENLNDELRNFDPSFDEKHLIFLLVELLRLEEVHKSFGVGYYELFVEGE